MLKKAVIPAAGLGTRFLPITRNSPKEMLPLVDKPAIQYVVEEAPSDLGILGRYVLTPRIFDCLEQTKPGVGKEIQLTDALRLLRNEQAVYAYEFNGKRYDSGNKLEWLKTTFDVALSREDLKEELLRHIKKKIEEVE
jgi:UTP--glucose-1-phosphate uridylyltransferase